MSLEFRRRRDPGGVLVQFRNGKEWWFQLRFVWIDGKERPIMVTLRQIEETALFRKRGGLTPIEKCTISDPGIDLWP